MGYSTAPEPPGPLTHTIRTVHLRVQRALQVHLVNKPSLPPKKNNPAICTLPQYNSNLPISATVQSAHTRNTRGTLKHFWEASSTEQRQFPNFSRLCHHSVILRGSHKRQNILVIFFPLALLLSISLSLTLSFLQTDTCNYVFCNCAGLAQKPSILQRQPIHEPRGH